MYYSKRYAYVKFTFYYQNTFKLRVTIKLSNICPYTTNSLVHFVSKDECRRQAKRYPIVDYLRSRSYYILHLGHL